MRRLRGVIVSWCQRQGGVMRSVEKSPVGILVLAACVAMAAGCAEAAKVSTEENSLLAPATVSVESGDWKNVVQWTAVPGAITYNLYWDVREPVTRTDANRLDQVVSPYTHSGLQNGAHYYYVVTAVYPGGESPESSQVSAAPRAPVLTAPEAVTLVPADGAITIQAGLPWPERPDTRCTGRTPPASGPERPGSPPSWWREPTFTSTPGSPVGWSTTTW